MKVTYNTSQHSEELNIEMEANSELSKNPKCLVFTLCSSNKNKQKVQCLYFEQKSFKAIKFEQKSSKAIKFEQKSSKAMKPFFYKDVLTSALL